MAKKKAKAKTKPKKRKKAQTKRKSAPKRRPAPQTKRRATKAKPAKKAAKAKKRPKAARRARPATKPQAGLPSVPSINALPEIEVETTSGPLKLADLKGRNVVLYFYPKDDTPGCTTEGCEIRDRYDDFHRHDTVVYGVSRDGIGSHERFKAKFNFPFELIADSDEKLCRAFGVMKQKSLYGRSYLGVDRSTFVFDKAGLLRKEFRGVKVPGHADEVLEEIRKL